MLDQRHTKEETPGPTRPPAPTSHLPIRKGASSFSLPQLRAGIGDALKENLEKPTTKKKWLSNQHNKNCLWTQNPQNFSARSGARESWVPSIRFRSTAQDPGSLRSFLTSNHSQHLCPRGLRAKGHFYSHPSAGEKTMLPESRKHSDAFLLR